jgi:hypothetical protein
MPETNQDMNNCNTKLNFNNPRKKLKQQTIFTDKKENKIFLIYKEIQLQSHRWGRAS